MVIVKETHTGTAMKPFEELGISTQTVIADSGLMMDIERCFREIPVEISAAVAAPVPTTVVVDDLEERPTKVRGGAKAAPLGEGWILPGSADEEVRRMLELQENWSIYRRNTLAETEQWTRLIPYIKCRAMYFKSDLRVDPGFPLKHRERFFRNALNVVLSLGDKCINFKLSKNGKFQLTGCKFLWHAQVSVTAFLHMIQKHCPGMIPSTSTRVYFQTVMTNMDFNVGHTINRQNLDKLMNDSTPYYSLLETSFGYTGVNIKFPIPDEWWTILEVPLVTLSWGEEDKNPTRIHEEKVVYDRALTPADRTRLANKKKFNTFLVFHSGNVIMSGMNPQIMKADYVAFTGLLTSWNDKIREHIKA
jgi:TATA-box binding protein (TBP) (component of TFIID and TFIIIB)